MKMRVFFILYFCLFANIAYGAGKTLPFQGKRVIEGDACESSQKGWVTARPVEQHTASSSLPKGPPPETRERSASVPNVIFHQDPTDARRKTW